MDDIVQWISTINETNTQLIVKFNIEDKETYKTIPREIITRLPIGWQCEQQG